MKVILFSKGIVAAIQANLVTSQQDFYWDLWSENQLMDNLCQNSILNCIHVSMHFSLLFTFHISVRTEWMDVAWLRSDSLIFNRFIQHCLHIWREKIDSALLWKCPDSENRKLEIFGFLQMICKTEIKFFTYQIGKYLKDWSQCWWGDKEISNFFILARIINRLKKTSNLSYG